MFSIEGIYTAARRISEQVARLPIALLDSDNNTVKDHPCHWLLNESPHAPITSYDFLQWLTIDKIRCGNGVALIARDKEGNPAGIYEQNASRITPTRDKEDDYELFYKVALDSGISVKFPWKDVIVVKDFFFTGVMGTPIHKILGNTLQTVNATTEYARDFYSQGITPDGTVELTDAWKSGGAVSDAALNEIRRDFEDKYSGGSNMHKAIVLPQGATFKPFVSDMAKQQALESQKYYRDLLFSIFGTGSDISGDDKILSFVKMCIAPVCVNMEKQFTLMLLNEDERHNKGLHFKFNMFAIERGGLINTMDAVARAINNGVETVNEGRGMFGLPAVESGDVLKMNSAIQDANHSTNTGGSNENSPQNKETI